MASHHYFVQGMTCASCKELIEHELKNFPGLKSAVVNYGTETVHIQTDDQYNTFDFEKFAALLSSLGYKVQSNNPSTIESLSPWANFLSRFVFSEISQGVISLSFGTFFMLLMFYGEQLGVGHNTTNLFQMFITTGLLFLYGKKYFWPIWIFLKTGHSNMYTLLGIGIYSSYLYSFYLIFQNVHNHLFVESVPFIMGFNALGKYFEGTAKSKAQGDWNELYKLQVKFAQKIHVDPENPLKQISVSTPVLELKIGDTIKIRPGEKIPLDGVVKSGSSHVNESAINGESIPRSLSVGDQVFSGALNLEGVIFFEVMNTFHDSLMMKVVRSVESAENKKMTPMVLIDKIIQYFVPIVIVLALSSGIFWWINQGSIQFFFHYFIPVLVVACPCAIGLAAPLAISVATRETSKLGFLIESGEVLGKACRINTIVFDKTGTLTEGHPKVQKFQRFNGDGGVHDDFFQQDRLSEENVFQWIKSTAALSNHPLSKAIVAHLHQYSEIDPETYQNIPGVGVKSSFDYPNENPNANQISISLGRFVAEEKFLREDQVEIGSMVSVLLNDKIFGYFVIHDQLRQSSYELIKKIQKSNMEVHILSGDRESTVRNVAEKLGIKNFQWEVSPDEKVLYIEKLQQMGKKVAMMGDGINDAPALKSADLSIAMALGSDLAISSSEVTILDEKTHHLANFFELAKISHRTLVQNITLSSLYNLISIPLAMGVFISFFPWKFDPKIASLLMGLSSISVILNTLRIRQYIKSDQYQLRSVSMK